MKQNISKLVFSGLLIFLSVASCDKKLEVSDKNNPLQESYFKTAAELVNGVNSVYSSIRGGNLIGREWFFLHDMRGAETAAGGVQLEQPRAELLNQPNPNSTNSVMTDVYRGLNQMINKANMVIAKAPDVKDNSALRDRVVGEAKFLRAWAYFDLVSQWGDVPMYTEPITSTVQFKGKSPAAEIYTLIISDLTAAAAVLPTSYSGADLGRVTKGAAYAMLGRVQMQKGDYTAARTALLNIYQKYTLVDNFLDNFDGDLNQDGVKVTGHEFNSESVLEVAFFDKGDANFNWGYNGEGSGNPVSIMRPQEYGIFWGNVVPSNRILDEFEAGDPRFKFTFFEEGDMIKTKSGAGEVLPAADMNVATSTKGGVTKKRVYRKYSDLDWIKNGFHPGGFNQRVIRYADVLLMLAECEAEIGTPAKAAAYINEVRARTSVNMPSVAPATKNDALKAVMHERAVELAGEEINNIDILRWRKKVYFPSIIADPKPGQVEFLPIPFAETSTNPEIK
jgi:starch-binding outer membrane protein, SusD/RagB family